MSEFRVVALTRERLYEAIVNAYTFGKMLLLEGKRVVLIVMELEDSLTARQRRFFHGPLLKQISEQVRLPDGTRYMPAVWKQYLKERILEREPRWVEIRLPGQGPRMLRKWWSTEELGVKRYSDFIDESIAIAATEWGVAFRFLADERDAVRYTAPQRKKQPEKECEPC